MPDVTAHAPGAFSSVELSTTDQKAAVVFYRALFGWGLDEQPMGPGETYSLLKMRGQDVAAAATMQAQERQSGAPSHWNLYVTVENADESARQATSLGGTVLAPPFDVMEHGRMAVVQDPTGAVFCLWQPKQHIGVRITNEPGALCWSELTTRDTGAAETFYTALFGWSAKHNAPGAPMAYTEFSVAGQPSIGMMAMPVDMPGDMPSYWMPYFQVENRDASAKKATSLGARLMVTNDIPNTGRFAIIADPTGAMLALFEYTGTPG